ncbi:unnamed protein product [Nezara viridula]|uniref:Uncharacterized protein n=1 Tax=Nezara viridula TaxID=85310 RepID=A0A9P0H4A6_NEZVI|nr:unnamed protein product [Nezara viridula]
MNKRETTGVISFVNESVIATEVFIKRQPWRNRDTQYNAIKIMRIFQHNLVVLEAAFLRKITPLSDLPVTKIERDSICIQDTLTLESTIVIFVGNGYLKRSWKGVVMMEGDLPRFNASLLSPPFS